MVEIARMIFFTVVTLAGIIAILILFLAVLVGGGNND